MMKKILIIDDDEQVQDSLKLQLNSEGYQVVSAESGSDGLSVAETENPELIVLDLSMPDIDGVEVLRQLKGNIVTWDIPVVVFTAREDTKSRQQSALHGVLRFLRKPFSPKRLACEIERLLGDSGA